MRKDLEMWHEFIQHPSAYARGFMDFMNYLHASEISLFSDAAKKSTLGFGVVCQNSWTFSIWPENFIEWKDPSIEYLELFALLVGVKIWIHRFKDRRIILFCNNQAVVHMVNNTSSSCKNCMVLIRKLVLESLKNNMRIFACYIKSGDNKAADFLSRIQIDHFFELKNTWDDQMTHIPDDIWQVTKIWMD